MEFDNSMVFGGNSIFDGLLLGLQSLPAIVNCAYCEKGNLTENKNGCTDESGDIWFYKKTQRPVVDGAHTGPP